MIFETLAMILWLALCYIAGYLLGLCFAEWLNRSEFRKEFFTHV